MLYDEAEEVLAECGGDGGGGQGGGISSIVIVSKVALIVVIIIALVFVEFVMILVPPTTLHTPPFHPSIQPQPQPPTFLYAAASVKPATTRKVSPLCRHRLSPEWRETLDNYGDGRPDVCKVWGGLGVGGVCHSLYPHCDNTDKKTYKHYKIQHCTPIHRPICLAVE